MHYSKGSVGRSNFVERHGLARAGDEAHAARAIRLVSEHGLEVVRLSFVDQHGLLRGKSIMAAELSSAIANGCAMPSSLLAKDTAHRTVFPVFSPGGGFGMPEMAGVSDILMVPDPATFRVLPWARATGWMLCDLFFPNGQPVPFCTRQLCRNALSALEAKGYAIRSGLEVECHILKLEDLNLNPERTGQPGPPPDVSLLAHGFQYLTEQRLDELDRALDVIRTNIVALDLPLRSVEAEYGPSQCEFTFHPRTGMDVADDMVLFRSAVKQVARRNGLHATFMCRPGIANLFSSGWHLHQSLEEIATGANAFVPNNGNAVLSPVGLSWVAGLLTHARAASVFTTPTINGYKRYKPNSLAPDRAAWGCDNKGTMIRAIGGPGEASTRIENRMGEPAANPYLYLASQVVSGLDGIERDLDPGPPTDRPYETDAPPLPRSLIEALAALREDSFFRDRFGGPFIDYISHIKEAEIARFLSEVTDWEHREYFDVF